MNVLSLVQGPSTHCLEIKSHSLLSCPNLLSTLPSTMLIMYHTHFPVMFPCLKTLHSHHPLPYTSLILIGYKSKIRNIELWISCISLQSYTQWSNQRKEKEHKLLRGRGTQTVACWLMLGLDEVQEIVCFGHRPFRPLLYLQCRPGTHQLLEKSSYELINSWISP